MEKGILADTNIFDSHVHFQLCGSVSEGIAFYFSENSIFICNSTGKDDWKDVLSISKADKSIAPALGIHPWYALENSLHIDELEELIRTRQCKFLGECGLDKTLNKKRGDYKTQLKVLEFQLELAVKYKLTVSLHCVRAWGDLLRLVARYSSRIPGIMIHAFTGSKEVMYQLLDLGVFISFSIFTFKNKNSKVVTNLCCISKERILLDSDYPAFKEQPISEYPGYMEEMYTLASDIKGMDILELSDLVYRNGKIFSDSAFAR